MCTTRARTSGWLGIMFASLVMVAVFASAASADGGSAAAPVTVVISSSGPRLMAADIAPDAAGMRYRLTVAHPMATGTAWWVTASAGSGTVTVLSSSDAASEDKTVVTGTLPAGDLTLTVVS